MGFLEKSKVLPFIQGSPSEFEAFIILYMLVRIVLNNFVNALFPSCELEFMNYVKNALQPLKDMKS